MNNSLQLPFFGPSCINKSLWTCCCLRSLVLSVSIFMNKVRGRHFPSSRIIAVRFRPNGTNGSALNLRRFRHFRPINIAVNDAYDSTPLDQSFWMSGALNDVFLSEVPSVFLWIGFPIPGPFSNPGISGLKSANPGIPRLIPGLGVS